MEMLKLAALGAAWLVTTTALAQTPETAPATGANAAADAAPRNCPRKKLVAPVYPPAAAIKGVAGTVKLRYKQDACGRVTQAEVVSGPSLLRDPSLKALKRTVYGPPSADAVSLAVDGWYETESKFGLGGKTLKPKDLGWPSTHEQARYELETSSEFPDVAAVTRITAPVKISAAPPYEGLMSRFVATGTQAQPEFWLVMRVDGQSNLAARYRPVIVDGEPVVRLLVVCDRPAEQCARDRAFLMKGAEFAKATN